MAISPEPVSPELLAVLRCPETGQSLHPADEEERSRFPGSDEAFLLVNAEGTRAYPVEGGFPILLKERALRARE